MVFNTLFSLFFFFFFFLPGLVIFHPVGGCRLRKKEKFCRRRYFSQMHICGCLLFKWNFAVFVVSTHKTNEYIYNIYKGVYMKKSPSCGWPLGGIDWWFRRILKVAGLIMGVRLDKGSTLPINYTIISLEQTDLYHVYCKDKPVSYLLHGEISGLLHTANFKGKVSLTVWTMSLDDLSLGFDVAYIIHSKHLARTQSAFRKQNTKTAVIKGTE